MQVIRDQSELMRRLAAAEARINALENEMTQVKNTNVSLQTQLKEIYSAKASYLHPGNSPTGSSFMRTNNNVTASDACLISSCPIDFIRFCFASMRESCQPSCFVTCNH